MKTVGWPEADTHASNEMSLLEIWAKEEYPVRSVIPKVGVHVPLNYTKFGTMVFTKWFLGNFN